MGLCICSWDSIYGLGMTQGYQLDQLLSLRLLKSFFDIVLLELGGIGTPSRHSGVLRASIWTMKAHSDPLKVMGGVVGGP